MSDPVHIYGAIISVSTVVGGVALSAAWRSMGRIEGTTARWAERIDDMSKEVRAHAAALALLTAVPEKVADLGRRLNEVAAKSEREHDQMKGALESLAAMIRERACEKCPAREGAQRG